MEVMNITESVKKQSTEFYRRAKKNGEKWSCPACSKVYSNYSKNNKRQHLLTHIPECERPYQCSYENCQRGFTQKVQLKTHLKRHLVAKVNSKPRQLKCTEEQTDIARQTLIRLVTLK